MKHGPDPAALVICLVVVGCARPGLRASPPAPAAVDSIVSESMRRDAIPGIAVALVQGGRVALVHGYGVTEVQGGPPVDYRTLFQLGSVTKMVTALLVTTLAARHELALDAPVADYITGLPAWAGGLTLHRLLSQTAGLRDMPADSGPEDEAALGAFVRAWGDDMALLPPGAGFSYSNPGYALAGAVVSEAERLPFAEVAAEQLLRPLGMASASFRRDDVAGSPHATGHRLSRTREIVRLGPAANDTRFWPAGYLFASAGDMARLLLALVNDGVVDGRRVIPSAAIRRVATPWVRIPVDIPGASYGYGLILQSSGGVRTAWHDGSMPGFSAHVLVMPDRHAGVAVLANREGADLAGLARVLLGLPAADGAGPDTSRAAAVAPAEARAMVGRYVNRWPFDLLMAGDTLVLRRFGQELPVRRVGRDHYVALAPDGRLEEFRVLRDGRRNPRCLLIYIWALCRESPSARGAHRLSP